jgi:hypothetical protein
MTPLDLLKRISESAGPLRRVMGYYFNGSDGFLSHVVLEFDSGRLTLSAVEDDDTIALSGAELRLDDPKEYEVREVETLSGAHGKSLFWGWTMTNHQGYPDGVRLEFRNTVSDPALVFEVVVVASILKVYVATEAG